MMVGGSRFNRRAKRSAGNQSRTAVSWLKSRCSWEAYGTIRLVPAHARLVYNKANRVNICNGNQPAALGVGCGDSGEAASCWERISAVKKRGVEGEVEEE